MSSCSCLAHHSSYKLAQIGAADSSLLSENFGGVACSNFFSGSGRKHQGTRVGGGHGCQNRPHLLDVSANMHKSSLIYR